MADFIRESYIVGLWICKMRRGVAFITTQGFEDSHALFLFQLGERSMQCRGGSERFHKSMQGFSLFTRTDFTHCCFDRLVNRMYEIIALSEPAPRSSVDDTQKREDFLWSSETSIRGIVIESSIGVTLCMAAVATEPTVK